MFISSCSTVASPSVWVGCLACYNNGYLIGQWVNAEDADSLTPDDLHKGSTSHEELWCFDLEGFPQDIGELPPTKATQWGRLYREVGKTLWPAFLAWSESGCATLDSDDLPCVSSFEEAFCGEYDSFEDYAQEFANEIGLTNDWPNEAQRYFDWSAWACDLAFDYTVLDSPQGVFVFHSY